MEMEDPGTGGAGRVRLADFYDAALNKGKYQLVESPEYLRQLGALDESNPDNLRVLIANYVNGPSNCLASSSYYSVCCVNECDELLGHLETKIAAPDASPETILALVAALPSSTVQGDRSLPSWLTHRLHEVAQHHDGAVPLHGRLFGQWMHYAFPRECAFPHVLGATNPQTAEAYVKENQQDFAANVTEMKHYVSMAAPHQRRSTETGELAEVLTLESSMWTMEEELVVCRTAPAAAKGLGDSMAPWIRGLMFMGAIVAGSVALVRSVDPKLGVALGSKEKYFV